ncbi:DUF2510 domain-containing protein [Microlunatus soli]|uniref:DUF2510 domain-containing protein n=1 Tax=Microlunatus soli TaxID=630515 RepID=UPI001E4D2A7B|nr:DUF2510 domain-containing protein [Microlunatus soli]
MSTPAAGWFPDPAGRPDSYRWWDGAAWTHYLTDDPTGPAPIDSTDAEALRTPAVPPASTPSTGGAPADPSPLDQPHSSDQQPQSPHRRLAQAEAQPIPSAAQRTRRQMPPGYEFSRPERASRRPSRRLSPVVALIAALLVGAVGVAAVVKTRTEASSLLQPPPPVSSAELAKIRVEFDESTRVVTAKPLQVTMPGAPYETSETPGAGYGVFKPGAVESSLIVQKDYNGKGDPWVGVVAAGVYGPEQTGKDVETTAERVFQELADSGYDGMKISIKNATSKKLKGYQVDGWIATGDIHYKEKGIKSTYDIVSVLVIDGGSGQHVGWLTSRPNKSTASAKAAVAASIKSIKIN